MITKAEVAQDVINRINAGLIIPLSQYKDWDVVGFIDDRDAKECFSGKVCHVCAKGAIFLAVLDKKNSLTLDQMLNMSFSNSTQLVQYLDMFTANELRDLEAMFEGAPKSYWNDDSRKFIVSNWNNDRKAWLIALMQHIVKYDTVDVDKFVEDNNGTC